MYEPMQQSIILCVGSNFSSRQRIEQWDNFHLSSSLPPPSSVCVTVMVSEVILATFDDFFAISNNIAKAWSRYHKSLHLCFRHAVSLMIRRLI